MTKDEALDLALEELENNRREHYYCEDTWYSCPKHEDGCANEAQGDKCNCGVDKANQEIDRAITAIKQARSATVQEPSGFFRHEDVCGDEVGPPTPYYLTPPAAQRQWVGLTDEDLANCSGHEVRWALYWEKLLKGKNT